MTERYDAVVVGAGPNGLAAAIALAQAGQEVLVVEAGDTPGGGARSAALTLPGFVHDVCSAIHPLAVTSPFLRSLPLEAHGLEWIHPGAPLAHPFDDGTAAVLERSLEKTVEGLGDDGPAYAALLGPFVRRWTDLVPMLLAPWSWPPAAPFLMGRFGWHAFRSSASLARSHFDGAKAQGLFAGCAAHSFNDLERLLSASFGLVLAAAGHAVGWPLPRGGSQSLVTAMTSYLTHLGGKVRTGWRVERLEELPASDTVFFDTSPMTLLAIAGSALPESYRRRVGRFRRGSGVFKLDYALSGPVPWTAYDCHRAGTLHLGGTLAELVASEGAVLRGEVPEKPYVLVAQQSLFDPSRAPPGQHTLWAYCHVPNGSTVDMTERIESQIERFAPGFRKRVVARHAMGPAAYEAYNANYAGGDISAGAIDGVQLFFRPLLKLNPYATPNPRLWLCSASTPPGPGVHGMCGFNAVDAVLRQRRRAPVAA